MEARLHAWLPAIKEGARGVVGERVLRRIRDSLASAAEQLADDADPSREFDWLVRELADPAVVACLGAADLRDATERLAALQAELARKKVDHQLAQAAERLAHVEARLAELETGMAVPGAVVDRHLARVVAGDLDSAQAEIERLAELIGLPGQADLPDAPVLPDPKVMSDGTGLDAGADAGAGAARERLIAQLQQLRNRYDAL